MDYEDIRTLSLSYADRQDKEVSDRIDNFLEVVESRINRALKVSSMSIRSTLDIIPAQEYYGLPSDFGGFRDIQINLAGSVDVEGRRKTLKYLNPEQMNHRSNSGNAGFDQVYYTLAAQQLQISPPQDEGLLEIIYYQKLVPLSVANPINWMSQFNPDGYIFGVLVEISSFVKDGEAASLWDRRFKEVIAEIEEDDGKARWSGTPLEVKLG